MSIAAVHARRPTVRPCRQTSDDRLTSTLLRSRRGLLVSFWLLYLSVKYDSQEKAICFLIIFPQISRRIDTRDVPRL